jgi:hypothetical protein
MPYLRFEEYLKRLELLLTTLKLRAMGSNLRWVNLFNILQDHPIYFLKNLGKL